MAQCGGPSLKAHAPSAPMRLPASHQIACQLNKMVQRGGSASLKAHGPSSPILLHPRSS
eukprot:CAMPEP_0175836888 /NCGR_PEP_ID=MMETSP0107_2-20121207/17388_1 /TAXON_ID=195067 ORGANISM="Goniomonas pacifica, Strain CCMP1869" /NCGR_SAMPLE_ID=MMETSP0107_2 /ASSEMBLY_ACC=CAM_ASM_000203 /LENGTH=58 /DNA_ID=CAMNT_0017150323 /DNA_START=205 /DNA_END=381 /DNA_ORIENTATION=+